MTTLREELASLADLADMDTDALYERLKPWLGNTHLATVVEGERVGPVTKLGGRPWLLADETWPTCKNCGERMALIIQLDGSSLPDRAIGGSGLIQAFLCLRDEPGCKTWEPFASGVLARRISAAAGGEATDVVSGVDSRSIEGWTRVEDLPVVEELESLGAHLSAGETDALIDAHYKLARGLTVRGNKLGGYPNWPQGVNYPRCKVCSRRMNLIFQIENAHPSSRNGPATAFLAGCPEHADELAFWRA